MVKFSCIGINTEAYHQNSLIIGSFSNLYLYVGWISQTANLKILSVGTFVATLQPPTWLSGPAAAAAVAAAGIGRHPEPSARAEGSASVEVPKQSKTDLNMVNIC